jgi:lantibiotic modifying enzyme
VTAPVTARAGPAQLAADALSAAVAIGHRLVAEAIWSGDRCNWVGAEPVDLRGGGVGSGLTHRALGCGLYGGSGGVALFLAELSGATGLAEFRPTALAAMRHALSRRDDVNPAARLGFYTGWAGLAATATRTGLLLDSAEFIDAGTALFRDVSGIVEVAGQEDAAAAGQREYDLMSGCAGAVVALAVASRRTGDDAIRTAAAAAAEWLLGSARKTRTGWSWRSPGLRNQHDLTGLSHGVAGVAVALLEAFRVTGEDRFASGARNAMRYENRWLDAGEGNWPDFRENLVDRRARTFVALWCHGAPGIALSRLYAYERLGEARWRQDALTALGTTDRLTRRLADRGGSDFSLCHGLSGNAECFLEAGRVLGGDAGAGIPWLVAEHGLQRYARPGLAWPCGTHADETPNLMLGLAGIGWFYLRLAAPDVPSVLLPVRWDR